jgi:MSHA pilin protein MshA
MKKSQGFTLVELVIVIVILGILAVTAAPKFLNLSGDAKASTLNAVKASIESANAQVYAKAIIAGQQNAPTYLTTVLPKVNLVYGYVDSTDVELAKVLDLTTTDWKIATGIANTDLSITTSDATVQPFSSTTVDANTKDEEACVLVYKKSGGVGAKPVIELYTQGC